MFSGEVFYLEPPCRQTDRQTDKRTNIMAIAQRVHSV